MHKWDVSDFSYSAQHDIRQLDEQLFAQRNLQESTARELGIDNITASDYALQTTAGAIGGATTGTFAAGLLAKLGVFGALGLSNPVGWAITAGTGIIAGATWLYNKVSTDDDVAAIQDRQTLTALRSLGDKREFLAEGLERTIQTTKTAFTNIDDTARNRILLAKNKYASAVHNLQVQTNNKRLALSNSYNRLSTDREQIGIQLDMLGTLSRESSKALFNSHEFLNTRYNQNRTLLNNKLNVLTNTYYAAQMALDVQASRTSQIRSVETLRRQGVLGDTTQTTIGDIVKGITAVASVEQAEAQVAIGYMRATQNLSTQNVEHNISGKRLDTEFVKGKYDLDSKYRRELIGMQADKLKFNAKLEGIERGMGLVSQQFNTLNSYYDTRSRLLNVGLDTTIDGIRNWRTSSINRLTDSYFNHRSNALADINKIGFSIENLRSSSSLKDIELRDRQLNRLTDTLGSALSSGSGVLEGLEGLFSSAPTQDVIREALGNTYSAPVNDARAPLYGGLLS